MPGGASWANPSQPAGLIRGGLAMPGRIRFLRGRVRFSVKGKFPERFMNLCATRGYTLWDATRTEQGYEFSAWAGQYKKLRPCAKKAGVVLRITSKKGLPFLLGHHKKRWGAVVGGVVCVALLLLSNLFLWDISIIGLSTLQSADIMAELLELGVYQGALRDSVDVRSVERRLMMSFDEIGWVAVNIRGTQVEVRVQERVMPPQRFDSDTPCNVVALRAGQIVAMQVYVGQPMVAVGDAVAQGDVLLSGVVEDKNRDMHLVAARGSVTAHTTRELEVQVAMEQTASEYVGVMRRYSLSFWGIEIPLWIGREPQGSFKLEKMYSPLTLFGQSAPIGVVKRQYILTGEKTVTLTPSELEEQADEKIQSLEKELLSQAVVLERKEGAEVKNGIYSLKILYKLEENIALQQEIFTD